LDWDTREARLAQKEGPDKGLQISNLQTPLEPREGSLSGLPVRASNHPFASSDWLSRR